MTGYGRGEAEMVGDFGGDHAGVGDDQSVGEWIEYGPFQLQEFAVFGLEGAEPGFPGGLEGLAAFEPCPVDAVAGAVGVAVPDALEEKTSRRGRGFGFLKGVGEMAGVLPWTLMRSPFQVAAGQSGEAKRMASWPASRRASAKRRR